MGIWATEVEIGVSAQSLENLLYFHFAKDEMKKCSKLKVQMLTSRQILTLKFREGFKKISEKGIGWANPLQTLSRVIPEVLRFDIGLER